MADNNHVLQLTAAQLDEALEGGRYAVRFTEQALEEEQKAQARANIGAATVQEVLDALPIYAGEVEDA